MKLNLEVFREVVVLHISEKIELREIDLLLVGFNRLLELGLRWMVLDLSHSRFDEEVLNRFKQVRPQLESKLQNLLVVGPAQELCDEPDLLAAYYTCQKKGSSEARFLIEKLELEEKIHTLQKMKEMAAQTDLIFLDEASKKVEINRLRRETFRLKKLQSFLINDLVTQAYHTKKSEVTPSVQEEAIHRCNEYLLKIGVLTQEKVS